MRALFLFGKRERLRFVSHLDLQRFMHRAFNRTNLPIAFSQGFNPHPVMSFASALAMGWTSEYEILDIKLARDVAHDDALNQMRAALPPDLPVYDVRLVEDAHPKMMASVAMADYRFTLSGDGAQAVIDAVPAFLAEQSVIALRKTKSGEKPTDIRPMAVLLQTDGCVLNARLMLTEAATLKPDLLISVLAQRAGESVPEARVHRLKLLAEQDGQIVPLLDMKG